MDVESQRTAEVGREERNRNGLCLVVILVGAPGSGKSTFCEAVIKSASRPWVRICQDIIRNGKGGTKAQCINNAINALKERKNVFIDRCNLDREQRSEFVKLGGPQIEVHAVVLDLPAKTCISRSIKRTGHEGHLQGGKAAQVVNRMLQKKELPKLSEGFSRITVCQNEIDVQTAVNTYSVLGPFDSLPSGSFGQRNSEAKIQLGIMKFLKKVEDPTSAELDKNKIEDSLSTETTRERDPSCIHDVPTLAFPSISTADFQFNYEMAADIIVEKVEEFVNKIDNARLVLVDLSHGSKILSLTKVKAEKKNINSNRFFTFVGDITRLYSCGGLHCNVIANAANWRLKPGGGGVNAAIFGAAGPVLEAATKERAKSLNPGKTVVVPLPTTSPLFVREGITHVIHVLGPNMNPQRPNCLNNDYIKGCEILREAYTSLFEGFASIMKADHKNKGGESVYDSERTKKNKGNKDEFGSDVVDNRNKKGSSRAQADGGMVKPWSSWAQALYKIAMNPEKHKNDLIEILEDVVVVNDIYPKAQRHLLVLARSEGLDCLMDVREEHIQLLRTMHAIGLKWAEKFLHDDPSLAFRLGYHLAPSMRQLHLHVISQDFNSNHLKNKKHWNSFNSAFFRDSVDVIDEISKYGKLSLKDYDKLLSMELRCHRCRSAHPNIPRLKSHISNCRAPFPAPLLESGRLVVAQSQAAIDS